MTKIDQDKLLEHLNIKWKGARCPMCKTGSWEIQDQVFQLMGFTPGGFMVGGKVVPLVPVTCNNCANTVLVNALRSGAYTVPTRPAEPAPEGQQPTEEVKE